MNVLVVCAENVKRSLTIAHFLEQYARALNLDVHVDSAGFKDKVIALNEEWAREQGMPRFYDEVRDRMIVARDEYLRKKGEVFGQIYTRRFSKPITADLLAQSDIIFAVDPAVETALREKFPDHAGKIRIVRDFLLDTKLSEKGATIRGPFSRVDKPTKFKRGSLKETETKPSPKATYFLVEEASRVGKLLAMKLAQNHPEIRRSRTMPFVIGAPRMEKKFRIGELGNNKPKIKPMRLR